MSLKQQQLREAVGLFVQHTERFEEKFTSKGKLPRDKDWQPIRFAVRDNILGILVIRQELKNNVMEVDVCISDNPGWLKEEFNGTIVVATFILSQAYKCGSSMGIRFTENVEGGTIPVNIVHMAERLQVPLAHEMDGYITPKEARALYMALTGFSKEAERKVMELSLADKVSPERVCYMVHHLTWTLPEMEAVLLGSEWPERIILGSVKPEEYQLYLDAILRSRAAILGGFLDRKLQQKEVREGDKVIDLEGNDRQLTIAFDPRLYAKVYETKEDTPVPWTAHPDWTVPAGQRLVTLVRARDWPDFVVHFDRDLEAAKQMVATYRDGKTYFFYLAPRNLVELDPESLETFRKRLEEEHVILMICPETVSLLDADAIGRIQESHVMRHDIGTGEHRSEIVPQPISREHSASEITLVAVPPCSTIGMLKLKKLVEQGIYDERELAEGVNKHAVERRYHLTCDRIQALAYLLMVSEKEYPVLVLPSHLVTLDTLFALNPEVTHASRLLSVFVSEAQMSEQISALEQTLGNFTGDTESLKAYLAFLRDAKKKGRTVLSVQDKYAGQTGQSVHIVAAEPSATDVVAGAFNRQFTPDWINDFQGKTLEEVTKSQIWRAVKSAQRGQQNGVNFTEAPHEIITEALRYFVYFTPNDFTGPVYVNIVYSDGSQARPFPFFCLPERMETEMKTLREREILPIGAMSCRHPEMDTTVSHYWFRNFEVSVSGKTNAETDEFCYQRTKEKLSVIRSGNMPIRMALYQTGFQAPLVGFWRAVTEFLIEGNGQLPVLEIRPYYFDSRTKKYTQGTSWY